MSVQAPGNAAVEQAKPPAPSAQPVSPPVQAPPPGASAPRPSAAKVCHSPTDLLAVLLPLWTASDKLRADCCILLSSAVNKVFV